MLEELKLAVLRANLRLPEYGLVRFTWGNASGIDRETGFVVIKPSGVPYDHLGIDDLVVLDLDGNVVEGRRRPSSDAPTHLVLYRALGDIGGVVHTHSTWATVWAQAGMSIPALGTTHADAFFGDVPCTREMTAEEIRGDYERETGNVIVETLRGREALETPAVLVRSHGPFSWGSDALAAADTALVLELVAEMAYHALGLRRDLAPIAPALLDRHFHRKHGPDAYYGQR